MFLNLEKKSMKTEDVFKKFTLMRPEFRKGVYPRKKEKYSHSKCT